MRRPMTNEDRHFLENVREKNAKKVQLLNVKLQSFLSICPKQKEKREYVFIATNLKNSLTVSSVKHMFTMQPSQPWIFTPN